MEENNFEVNSFWGYQNTSSGNYSDLLFGDSYENLKELIKNPMDNNLEIRHLSRAIYSMSGLYSNIIDYMTSLLTLDRIIISKSKSEKKRKNNKLKMETCLKKIKDKEFIRDMLFRAMLDGIAVSYLETSNNISNNQKFMSDFEVKSISEINSDKFNISVCNLPADYIQIVGIKNGNYQIAFDLNYFTNCKGEKLENKLRRYPKEIRDAFYKRSQNAEFPNWFVIDNSRTIVLKIRSSREEKWGRPLVLQAIQDILYSDYWTNTKRNVLSEINSRIFYMEFPQGKEPGTSALTQTQQKQQHEMVKNGILKRGNSGGTNFFSVASGTKINKLDVDTSLFRDECEKDLKNDICTDLGFAASLLSGTSSSYSSQQNNLQLVISQVYSWVESISYELVKAINQNIIRDTENQVDIYYLPCSIVNRKEFVNQMKELYTLGHGSLSAWIASTGINPDAYLSLMEMEKIEQWDEKFKPHLTSFTASSNNNGRPENTDSINENTIKSKSNNSNNIPKVTR